MIKVKVVKFVLDISLKLFVDKMANFFEFSTRDNSCTLLEYDENSLSAEYVEKVVTRETIIDDQGNETDIDVVRYPRYEFQIQSFNTNGEFLLLVLNPPRSLKSLVEFLIKTSSNNIFFRELKFSLEVFLDRAKAFEGISSFTVDKVKAKGVQISGASYADVLVSSSGNAYQDLEGFLDKKNYKISNVRMRVKTKFGSGKVEISSSGLLGVDQNVFDEILDFFLKSSNDIVIK